MTPEIPHPKWDSGKPYDSLIATAEFYHLQAKHSFLEDNTHAHILFLISKEHGVVSVNPLPPNVTDKQILTGVRQAIKEHNLYAVITIAEAWTYFPTSNKDHTLVQLMHNEMRVADLRDEDKVECLMVRTECRDGDGFVWITLIVRGGENGDKVSLGESVKVPLEKYLKKGRFFGGRT